MRSPSKLPGMRQTGQEQRERARYDVTDHLRVIKKRIDETGEGLLFLQDHGSPAKFRNISFVRR